jgi:hypothetical protein
MSKLSIFIPVIVVMGFVLSDCKKRRHTEFVELDTDSGVITHFNFKKGTYWIYADALSGRIDSFYVRENEYIAEEEGYDTYDYHYIIIAELNVDGTNPGDSANWVFNYQGTQLMADYDYTNSVYGWRHQMQYKPLYVYPFYGVEIHSKTDSAAITRIDSFYTINGLSFRQAAHIYHHSILDSVTSGPFITLYTDSLVVNDSVGMIRISLNHPEHAVLHDWQLIRYNIVK